MTRPILLQLTRRDTYGVICNGAASDDLRRSGWENGVAFSGDMASTRVTILPRLSCAPGFRDLGGTPLTNGRRLSVGRLFRSDMIVAPDADDLAALDACDIGLVVDLRSATEIRNSPNEFWIERGIEVLGFNVGTDVRAKGAFWERLREDASPSAVHALMLSVYRSIPLAVAPALRVTIERLAAGCPAVLLNCAAGKDRTGVAVALLLHALGATKDSIMADYLATADRVTNEALARTRTVFAGIAGKPIAEASVDMLSGVRPEFLEASYSALDRRFGGIDAFLAEHVGLDDAGRQRLRHALCADEMSEC